MLGVHSECDPPDPFSNSAVKPLCAHDSVRSPHVKVGQRQAPFLLGYLVASKLEAC
jgi:hypothetical protein